MRFSFFLPFFFRQAIPFPDPIFLSWDSLRNEDSSRLVLSSPGRGRFLVDFSLEGFLASMTADFPSFTISLYATILFSRSVVLREFFFV